jgi:hypothetical protein
MKTEMGARGRMIEPVEGRQPFTRSEFVGQGGTKH